MRTGTYHVFEIVAWPAGVWCAIELGLRAFAGSSDGLGLTAATGAMAVLTIVVCRTRSAQLARAHVRD